MQAYSRSDDFMKRNLRHHLRVPTHIAATVKSAKGEPLPIEIANLSRTGIMLECNREILETLHPNQPPVPSNAPIEVSISFALPSRISGKVAIDARCAVVYTRRLSRDIFHVGLEFKQLESNLLPQIEEYIESHREQR